MAQCDLFITRNGKHDLNCIKTYDCKEYTPWRRMHIYCYQKQRSCRQSRRHGVALVGLAHPNKVPSPPNLKPEMLLHQWSLFLSIFQCQAFLIEDFPATVLHVECRTKNMSFNISHRAVCFVCTIVLPSLSWWDRVVPTKACKPAVKQRLRLEIIVILGSNHVCGPPGLRRFGIKTYSLAHWKVYRCFATTLMMVVRHKVIENIWCSK